MKYTSRRVLIVSCTVLLSVTLIGLIAASMNITQIPGIVVKDRGVPLHIETQIKPLPWLGEFAIGKSGRMIFITVNLCGRPVKMMVDTGSTLTGIDERYRTLLGSAKGTWDIETYGEKLEVEVFGFPNLTLGDIPLCSNKPVFCKSLQGLRDSCGVEFWGIVGMDVLRNYVVQFDFDSGIMRLAKAVSENHEPLGISVPITFGPDARPYVNVKCGNVDRDFIVDSGSTSTCIDRATFETLVTQEELSVGGKKQVVTSANTITAYSGLLRHLSIGPFTHDDILCDSNSRCVLGLRYLSRYVVTFDFPRQIAYLHQGEQWNRQDSRGFSGLRPARTANSFQIRGVQPGGPADAAGLQAGDEIVEIAGKTTTDMDMFAIGEILTSRPGQQVVLKMCRNNREFNATIVTRDRFR